MDDIELASTWLGHPDGSRSPVVASAWSSNWRVGRAHGGASIGASALGGIGLFTTRDCDEGDVIFSVRARVMPRPGRSAR